MEGGTNYILISFTTILSVYLLCGSSVADLDMDITGLDISGYRTIYEYTDALEHEDFKMYYIFYSMMSLGQHLQLSYRMWWAAMSIMALFVVFCACRIHRYNYCLFLAAFMAYHELIFYSGIKFFYGFCFLLFAYGFLLRNTRKGLFLFSIFVCIAGGFHIMYYFFLAFIVKPIHQPKYIIKAVVVATIALTVMIRVSGSAMAYMAPFFDAFDNEHINLYTDAIVRNGFYLAVFIHLIVYYVVWSIKKQKLLENINPIALNSIYDTVLISFIFFPFYAVTLTFMRLITAFSLIVVTASSSVMSDDYKSRKMCVRLSLVVALSFHFIQFLTSIGAERGFYRASVMPFFNVIH